MPATPRPTAARAPRARALPPPAPSGSQAARLAVVSWTVVVSAGLAGLGAVPAPRPVAPAGPLARPASSPLYTVTAAAATTTAPAPTAGAATTTGTAATVASVARMQPAAFTTALPDARARIAIATAMAQIGLPYVWGGNGPAAGDAGFDCSGLTTFSYAAAGVALPRTAQTQYYAGPHVPAGAALQPGDLVFYGTPAVVHHVGMYIGAGRMVNAPTFGQPVQTAYYRWTGDDYLGATRPAAAGSSLEGLLITVPDAAPAAPRSTLFAAPPAPLPATPLPDPTVPQPPEAATAAAAVAQTDLPVTPSAPTIPPITPPLSGAAAPAPGAPASGTPSPAPSAPDSPASGVTAPAPDASVSGTPTQAPSTPEPAPPTPTSTAPASPAPASSAPASSAPASSAPPSAPPAKAATPSTTPPPPAPEPPKPTTATVGGTTVTVAAVGAGANGLPRANGLWSRGGRPVLRLSAGLVGAGSTVTITHPDGSADTYSVTSRATLSTAEAARAVAGAGAGELVMVAAAGADSWIVVTAG